MSEPISAQQFEAQYAKRSGLTVDQLRLRRTVQACHCGSDRCQGWQSVSSDLDETDAWHTPEEAKS